MAVTYDIVVNVRANSESYQTSSKQISADAVQIVSDTVLAGAVNNTVAVADFATAKLESAYLSSTENLTVIFVGANNVTVTLVEDEPQEWHNGSWCASPFTDDVTSVIASNAGNNNAVLTGRFVTNA